MNIFNFFPFSNGVVANQEPRIELESNRIESELSSNAHIESISNRYCDRRLTKHCTLKTQHRCFPTSSPVPHTNVVTAFYVATRPIDKQCTRNIYLRATVCRSLGGDAVIMLHLSLLDLRVRIQRSIINGSSVRIAQ